MFVGFIEDLHYVSTVPHCRNANALRYLKFKLSETEVQHKERLEANLGSLHEQRWAKENIPKFHNSNNYTIYQCKTCLEAWPLKSTPKCINNYQCTSCFREKDIVKEFSIENLMVPSAVPKELSGLTQVEEMLIARALPIIHVYIKPRGQRGFSGHCINLPQNVRELAHSPPRYPKGPPVIVVRKNGKGNDSFKNLFVRRQVVSDVKMRYIGFQTQST